MVVGINKGRVFLKALVVALTGSLLQGNDCLRIVKVTFCSWSHAQLVISYRIKMLVYSKSGRIKALGMVVAYVLFNFLKADTANPAYSICKVFFDYILSNSHSFKNLSRLVRLDC